VAGILERLRILIASNINALIDSLSDPGAAIDELIGNMESAAKDARARVRDALTEDRRAAKLQESTQRSIAEWRARAERAVHAQDDALAKEALAQAAQLEEQLRAIDDDRSKAKTEIAELEHGLRDLDGKLSAVKARKETLKAVMRARANEEGGAAARYDRIVHGVDTAEAENELDEELTGAQKDASVKQRIDRLTSDADVADRLAALKSKMNK
jgi:phage shock protein A